MAGIGEVVLKYFDLSGWNGLCGLGGGIRFFFLTNGITYEDQTVTLDEWKAGVKQEAMKSGESITGHLPIVKLGGKSYIESVSILRMLARKLGQYGVDLETDYQQDMAADMTTEFRQAWHDAAMPDSAAEANKAYLTAADKRKHFYHVFNTLIGQTKGSGPHVLGSSPSFVDALLFAMLWDDVALFKGDEYLWVANPHLEAFFKAYLQQEPVLEWCKKMRPDMVA